MYAGVLPIIFLFYQDFFGLDTGYSTASAHTLDIPAQIIGGRTMLPLMAVLESVGYQLDWDGLTNTVSVV